MKISNQVIRINNEVSDAAKRYHDIIKKVYLNDYDLCCKKFGIDNSITQACKSVALNWENADFNTIILKALNDAIKIMEN